MEKLVVIGGGLSGIELIRNIEDKTQYDITLIEPKDYVEVPYGMLRALVDTEEYNKIIRRNISEIIDVKHIKAKMVTSENNKVILDNGQEVEYDKLVIATGSTSRGFEQLKKTDAQSKEEREDEWKSEAEKLKAAQNIAIIGGGTIGVELAAEIAETYPTKRIDLFHSESQVLNLLGESSGKKANKVLTEMNVNITLNEIVDIEERNNKYIIKGQEYDVLYKAIGNLTNIEIFKNQFEDNIEKGMLKVDKELKLEGYDNIWVLGDINNVPEIKLGTLAIRQADYLAKQLIGLELDRKTVNYKPVIGSLSFVTLGRQKGIAKLPFMRLDLLAKYKQHKKLFIPQILRGKGEKEWKM